MRAAPMALVVSVVALALAACATRPPLPKETGPAFVLTEALAGETVGRGEFSLITGQKRGFTANLSGSMQDGAFVLREEFLFDDGETDLKTWRFRQIGPGEWRGVREDVVGEARGYQDGPAFRLEYKINLGGRQVGFRDVLVSTPEGVVINRARVSYWGFGVGKVDLTISRREGA